MEIGISEWARTHAKSRARLSVGCANTTLKQSPADPAAVQTRRFQKQESLKAGAPGNAGALFFEQGKGCSAQVPVTHLDVQTLDRP